MKMPSKESMMQDKKLARFIFTALTLGALAILLVIGASASKYYMAYGRSQVLLFMLLSLLSALAVLFAGVKLRWGTGLSARGFLVLVLVLTLLPRLFWVLSVRTEPYSDFLHLYNYGVAASQGDFTHYVDFYGVFPFKFGFGFLVAGLFALFGAGTLVVPLYHVVLSLAMVILVYLVGKEVFSETAARASALFFALWPAQIMYNSVVAAENSFMVPFLGAIWLFVRFIKLRDTGKTPYGLLILSGVLIAAAQAFRPMAMILIPTFALYVLFFITFHQKFLRNLGIQALCILLVAASYFISLKLISLPIKSLSGMDISRSGSGFYLLVGSNHESKGRFNQEDHAIIAKYDFDFEKVHEESQKIAMERITSDPGRFARLVVSKIGTMWNTDTYGYNWSIVSAKSGSRMENLIKTYPRAFYTLSDFFWLFVLALSAIGAGFAWIRKNPISVLFYLILGGLFVAYCFLEVQSRYHFPAVPILILMAGFGASCLSITRKRPKTPLAASNHPG